MLNNGGHELLVILDKAFFPEDRDLSRVFATHRLHLLENVIGRDPALSAIAGGPRDQIHFFAGLDPGPHLLFDLRKIVPGIGVGPTINFIPYQIKVGAADGRVRQQDLFRFFLQLDIGKNDGEESMGRVGHGYTG